MNADTLNNMILGFSVILGTLLIYALSLFFRMRQAINRSHKISKN